MKFSLYIILMTVTCLYSCKKEQKKSDEDNSPNVFHMTDTMIVKCKFYRASVEDIKNEIRLFGKIQADNKKLAHVYSIVGGNVIKINVELGDYVKKGDILAIVRSSEVAGFQKEKLQAGSNVAIAEKNLQVAKDMFSGKLSSEKDVVAAEREFENAKAEYARINEIYEIYNLQNGSIFNITAPISGFIMQKDINQNEQLRADKSDVLFSIAEINEVWAIANVNESDISNIQLGYEAEVNTLSFPDEKYEGKIDKIFNAIDPATKAMKVRVRIPNPSFKLKPEMNATVTVRFKEDKKMIAVPSSAIIFDKSKNWIMVFRNSHDVETRRVEVYRQVGDVAYISSGLGENEKVISKYGILIYDAIND
jgi:cobalt-zinc-cadmium efflux system membrane fusion protein